jgi:arylsulfatase A-like enzyme
VIKTLDRLQLTENTLVVVTSDNGGVLDANGPDEAHGGTVQTNNGHAFNGPLQGGKGSIYEGGTRVPFIVSWPGRIKPATSDALICHIDMMATFAALTGQSLPDTAGPDSFNILPALLDGKAGRDHLVEHAGGMNVALRQGPWKYIPGEAGKEQLYDLSSDIGEAKNVAAQHSERAEKMARLLKRVCTETRSRP